MAGVVETTHTFANNEVITSTLMNNIIDQTLFTSDALSGGTLALTAGKLKVATSGITSNEMGVDAVIWFTDACGSWDQDLALGIKHIVILSDKSGESYAEKMGKIVENYLT